ncbi:hypothetical protein L1887_25282 [Cichorium endivia]|nr:hypothetical protein L1887_25282 [Cichorium endivia]
MVKEALVPYTPEISLAIPFPEFDLSSDMSLLSALSISPGITSFNQQLGLSIFNPPNKYKRYNPIKQVKLYLGPKKGKSKYLGPLAAQTAQYIKDLTSNAKKFASRYFPFCINTKQSFPQILPLSPKLKI